jgi:hypothetical protein
MIATNPQISMPLFKENAQEFCAASNHLMMLHFHELSVC